MPDPTNPSSGSPSDNQGWRPHLDKAIKDTDAAQGPGAAWPGSTHRDGPEQGYAAPGYAQPGYGPSVDPQPSYPPAGYGPTGYGPGGYSPTGYGPAGYPPPGYPGYPGYAPPPPTNGLAIGALVAGIVGWSVLPFISSIVAIILGHVALVQIRRTGEQGKGMALAGLILGYAGALVLGAIVALMFFTFVIVNSQGG